MTNYAITDEAVEQGAAMLRDLADRLHHTASAAAGAADVGHTSARLIEDGLALVGDAGEIYVQVDVVLCALGINPDRPRLPE